MLSPLDWQLASDWEKAGIPIFIVLAAIDDCCRKFKATKDPGKINTLRYFDQAVRQRFKTWNAGRVGANDTPADPAPIKPPPAAVEFSEPLPAKPPATVPPRPCSTCTGSMFLVVARDPITWIATAMIPCPECVPNCDQT